VLTSHKESNHDVGYFLVGEKTAAAVFLLHKGSNHVVLVLQKIVSEKGASSLGTRTHVILTSPAFLDDINIKFAHLEVGLISSAVAWQW
jgi:hypothetical protein